MREIRNSFPVSVVSAPDSVVSVSVLYRDPFVSAEGLTKEDNLHKRTGLEIFLGGWGGHEFARLAPKAREHLGGSRGMRPRKILKNRVSLMTFSAFWCGFLCMEQVINEKGILRILVKQNVNRKIARLLLVKIA